METAKKSNSRPYFVPPDVSFDDLPEEVRLAYDVIVSPAYAELVLNAPSSLERAMGVSFVFLLAEEVLSQFELGGRIDPTKANDDIDRERRIQNMSRHLRLVGAKTAALNSLLRLRKLPMHRKFGSDEIGEATSTKSEVGE